jgi:hypothetical protein
MGKKEEREGGREEGRKRREGDGHRDRDNIFMSSGLDSVKPWIQSSTWTRITTLPHCIVCMDYVGYIINKI